MKVLVTAVGSNTAIGIIKALRLTNDVYIVGIDVNKAHLCAGAKLVDEFVTTPVFSDKDAYTETLLNLVRNKKIACVIPVHDSEIEVVAEMKEAFPDATFWAVNSREIISVCNNKKLSNKKALEAGLKVPRWYDKIEQPSINCPVIVKPLDGVSSRGISKVESREELEKILGEDEDDLIIQEFVEDAVEYTIDAYSTYGGKYYGCVVRERIETRNGMSTKGVVVDDAKLEMLVQDYLNKLGFKGMSNLQFFKKNEEFYFIEINPRFSGGGILSVAANFNSPAFTLMEAKGEALPAFDRVDIKTGLFMTRYYEESFAYAENASV